jgi:hypothetical protein
VFLVKFSAKDLTVVLDAKLNGDIAVSRADLAFAADNLTVWLGDAPEHAITVAAWCVSARSDRRVVGATE